LADPDRKRLMLSVEPMDRWAHPKTSSDGLDA
jgi:hypothetical protein